MEFLSEFGEPPEDAAWDAQEFRHAPGIEALPNAAPASIDQRVALEELLRRSPHIWRGRGATAAEGTTLSTGFSELDAALGGGWPRHALTEIAVPAWGIGELRLLLPALLAIQQEGKPLAWIAPPYLPYAPALAEAGLDLRRLLLLEGLTGGDKDLWWAMEKILRSTTCGLVLAWPRRPGALTVLRRLQLAAAEGQSLGILLSKQLASGTPAALRLQLEAAETGLRVRILKLKGPAAMDGVWVGC